MAGSWSRIRCPRLIYPFARCSLIALMLEAVRTSETLVNINLTTRQYIPEDSKRHTRRRENPKSHKQAIS
jgi:preprotein translocase subunit SecB